MTNLYKSLSRFLNRYFLIVGMAKILLIDNDRASRQILEHAFKLYEYDVVTTHRGDEGLTLAITESPDLIVVDLDAVGLDGWQTIKILKKTRPTWLIPVIAMAEPKVNGQLLIQTGFDTYIRKPAPARHILKRVETLLDKIADKSLRNHNTSKALTTDKRKTGQATVVSVDDNSLNSKAMAEIVEGAGYSYANISDSLQVLSQLIDLRPQLIFLELVLPVANGYELCAQIRRISYFKETPIIIVGKANRVAERVRAKIAGASGFLSKPVRAKFVLKMLIKYLPSSNRA